MKRFPPACVAPGGNVWEEEGGPLSVLSESEFLGKSKLLKLAVV
jgi:hypothetical protein